MRNILKPKRLKASLQATATHRLPNSTSVSPHTGVRCRSLRSKSSPYSSCSDNDKVVCRQIRQESPLDEFWRCLSDSRSVVQMAGLFARVAQKISIASKQFTCEVYIVVVEELKCVSEDDTEAKASKRGRRCVFKKLNASLVMLTHPEP